MSSKKKLIIECGLDSLAHFDSSGKDDLLDLIANARAEADFHKIDLEILIYSGILSALSGGRERISNGKVMNRSLSETEKNIDCLNSHGVSFNLVLNGGLQIGLDLDVQILHGLDPVLNILVKNSQFHGIKNSVTITHPKLYDYIKQKYSDLSTIASCIKALYSFSRHDYGESFEKYDYVVPLNQHTTSKFLGKYKNYADKMILFLTLGCGTSNLEKCYRHYCKIELDYLSINEDVPPKNPNQLIPIRSQLTKKKYDCDNGELLRREEDLIGMISMQVNKFKIPRNGILKRSSFLKLIHYFNEHYPQINYWSSAD